jgi:hypothetical protein
MNGRLALLSLVFVAALAVAEADGFNSKTAFLFSFVAIPIGISWFFYSRRTAAPSAFETASASIWLLVRRLVCFTGALLFLVGAVMVGFALFQRATQFSVIERIGSALFMLALAALCVWVGIFGQGANRYAFRDDVELHQENKRRYRWRW